MHVGTYTATHMIMSPDMFCTVDLWCAIFLSIGLSVSLGVCVCERENGVRGTKDQLKKISRTIFIITLV